MKKVLILSSAETPDNIVALEKFRSEIQAELGAEFELTTEHYNNIEFELSEDNFDVRHNSSHVSFKTYDLVYFKSYYRYTEVATSIAEFLSLNNIRFVCSELQNYISFSKLSQYARLSRSSFSIPHTLYMDTTLLVSNYDRICEVLGDGFVCKAIDGKGGDCNFVVRTKAELEAIVSQYQEVSFVCQEMIPNEYDLRVLIVGGVVRLVIERRRTSDDTHLNNTSQGAGASLIDPQTLDAKATEMALASAALFKREIAGVDIMFRTTDNKPYILEVNASPQVSTGAFTEEKIKVYAELFRD